MKILRVRRGYTTNSSAASEFIPTTATPAQTSSGNQTAAPGTVGPAAAVMPAGSAATVTVAPAAPVTAAPGWSNSAMLGGLAGLVVLVFVAERILRWSIDRIRRGYGGES